MTLKTRSSVCKSKISTFGVFERQRAKMSITAIWVNIYEYILVINKMRMVKG